MNPVTRSLVKELGDPEIKQFAAQWDLLERLVIQVFREKQAGPEEKVAHRKVRAWLRNAYRQWGPALQPHWRQTSVAGQAATEDPFAQLLEIKSASELVGNWRAMQTLPAAREALNRLLLALIAGRQPDDERAPTEPIGRHREKGSR